MVDGVRQDIEDTSPPDPGGTGAGTLETSTPSIIGQQTVKGRKKLVLLYKPTALAFRMAHFGQLQHDLVQGSARSNLRPFHERVALGPGACVAHGRRASAHLGVILFQTLGSFLAEHPNTRADPAHSAKK
jgi:hypothetical protein